MGIFSVLSNMVSDISDHISVMTNTVGDESMKIIKKLRSWKSSRFSNNNSIYISETGNRINLYGRKIYLDQFYDPSSLKNKLKEFFTGDNKAIVLTGYISDYTNRMKIEIKRFNESVSKLKKISPKLQEDTFFSNLDHIFSIKLGILYNELLFCNFDRIDNNDYTRGMYRKLESIITDINELNSCFQDYMYALTKTEYENTSIDIEKIKIRVESMSKAADEFSYQQEY
jgi:hypothetical protein